MKIIVKKGNPIGTRITNEEALNFYKLFEDYSENDAKLIKNATECCIVYLDSPNYINATKIALGCGPDRLSSMVYMNYRDNGNIKICENENEVALEG